MTTFIITTLSINDNLYNCYAECRCAVGRHILNVMLSVVMLSVVMLSVVMLSVVMLSVVILNVVVSSVVVSQRLSRTVASTLGPVL